MGDADSAYAKAKELIAEAKASGEIRLSLSDTTFHALDRLPEEIAQLSELKFLGLSGTAVSGLLPLSGLTKLERLYLSGTRVADLSPLAGLNGLKWLDLAGTPVKDLSPLAGLAEVTWLYLADTVVDDVAPLAGLKVLLELDLSGTKVRNFSSLAELDELAWLNLSNTDVNDLTPLLGMNGLKYLSLSHTGLTSLTPLAGLTGLVRLDLVGTATEDLAPLERLTNLQVLDLSQTAVTDLRPLRRLSKLIEAPMLGGLRFEKIAATRADARLAEIAAMADDTQRAKALFDYLDTWVLPEPPAPDPFLLVEAVEGRLDVTASLPTEGERDERLKQALHARLVAKAADLAREAGNRFPRLARRARAVVGLVDRPFAEVDLLAVHLEVEDLAQRAATGAEEGESFPPEVAEALGDVVRLGPGLTLNHPDVEVLLERSRRMREAPPLAEVQAAQDELSVVVVADEAAIGDNLRGLESRVMAQIDRSVRDAVQGALHRNMLHKVGMLAAVGAFGVASNVAAGLIAEVHGGAIIGFVSTNWAVLTDVAASYGGSFLSWFHAVLLQVPDLRHLIRRAPHDR